MSETRHERPGVYSAYDASAVVSAGAAPKNIGVAAKAAGGTVGAAVTLTGYAAGVRAFGEDTEAGMSTILKLLFQNGASSVTAVRVADEGTLADYEAAFAVLGSQDVQVVVCDSGEVRVHQALRAAVESDSAVRRERIAVVGGSGETAAELVSLRSLAKSQVSTSVERLVRRGYLLRQPEGRKLHLRLLPAAEEAVRQGQDSQRRFGEAIARDFSPEEQAMLYGTLARMTENARRACRELAEGQESCGKERR